MSCTRRAGSWAEIGSPSTCRSAGRPGRSSPRPPRRSSTAPAAPGRGRRRRCAPPPAPPSSGFPRRACTSRAPGPLSEPGSSWIPRRGSSAGRAGAPAGPPAGSGSTAGPLHQALEVFIAQRPVLVERLHLAGGDEAFDATWGLGGFAAAAVGVAYPGSALLDLARSFNRRHAPSPGGPVRPWWTTCWCSGRWRPAFPG